MFDVYKFVQCLTRLEENFGKINNLTFFFSIFNELHIISLKMGNKNSAQKDAKMGNKNSAQKDANSESTDLDQATLKELKSFEEKQKVLQELDIFVLDNSLRETTVGQLRGHTLESKWEIYDQVNCY